MRRRPSPLSVTNPLSVEDDLPARVHHLGGGVHPDRDGLEPAREANDPAGANRSDDGRRGATGGSPPPHDPVRMRSVDRAAGLGHGYRAHNRRRPGRRSPPRRHRPPGDDQTAHTRDQNWHPPWHTARVGRFLCKCRCAARPRRLSGAVGGLERGIAQLGPESCDVGFSQTRFDALNARRELLVNRVGRAVERSCPLRLTGAAGHQGQPEPPTAARARRGRPRGLEDRAALAWAPARPVRRGG